MPQSAPPENPPSTPPELTLRRTERTAAAHALSAQLAHAIGTPLNVIMGRASLLRDDPDAPKDLQGHAEVVMRQARSLRQLIDEHLEAIRAGQPPIAAQTQALGPIARAAAELMQGLARRHRVEIATTADDDVEVRTDRDYALHAVCVALEHAVGHARPESTVRLRLDVADVEQPPARRCAPGRYARFVIDAEGNEGSPAADDGLTLAASEGSLRALGGYLEIDHEQTPNRRILACIPAR